MADGLLPGPEDNHEARSDEGQDLPRPEERSRTTVQSLSFIGPLPPPQLLREYEAICPGMADRMFTYVEQTGEHKRKLQSQIVDIQADRSRRQFSEARVGQIFAFLITITACFAGSDTALQGHEWAGSFIGVGGISGVVATFILGRPKEPRAPAPQPEKAPSKGQRHRNQ